MHSEIKPTPDEFMEKLWENEDCMGEQAAMMATCQYFNVEWDKGWKLIIKHCEQHKARSNAD